MTPLPKPIRNQVNQAAHRMALRYECELRNSLLARLQEIADSGATLDELTQTLIKTEAQTPRERF